VAGRPDPAASGGGSSDPWMGSAGLWMGSLSLFMDFFCFFIGLIVAGMATASVKVTIYHDL
jgi:hypothetical protein